MMIFNTNEYTAKSIYLGVSISGTSLTTIPPKYIKSFSVEKVTSDSKGSGKFKLELIAPNSTFTQGESNNFSFLLNYLLAKSLTSSEQVSNAYDDQKSDGYNSSIVVEYGWLGGAVFIMPGATVNSCKMALGSSFDSVSFTVTGVTNKILYGGYSKNFFSIKELAEEKLKAEDINVDAIVKFPKDKPKQLSYVVESLANFLYGDYYDIVVDHNDVEYIDDTVLSEFSFNEIDNSSLTLFNYLDKLIDMCKTFTPIDTKGPNNEEGGTPVISLNGKYYKPTGIEYQLYDYRSGKTTKFHSYDYNPMGNSESEYPFSTYEIYSMDANKTIVKSSTKAWVDIYKDNVFRDINMNAPVICETVAEVKELFKKAEISDIDDRAYKYLPGLDLRNYLKSSRLYRQAGQLETKINITDPVVIIKGADNKLYTFEEVSESESAKVTGITSGDSSKTFKKYFSRYTKNGKYTLHIKGETNDATADTIFVISNNNPNNTVIDFSLSAETLPAIAAMASLNNNATSQVDVSSGLAITASTDLGGLVANDINKLTLLQQELLYKLVNTIDTYISDASMTVIATDKSCNIEITDTIRVIPMINNGNTLFVGDYIVTSVTDNLSENGFTTTFDLKFAKSELMTDLETAITKQGVSLDTLNTSDSKVDVDTSDQGTENGEVEADITGENGSTTKVDKAKTIVGEHPLDKVDYLDNNSFWPTSSFWPTGNITPTYSKSSE